MAFRESFTFFLVFLSSFFPSTTSTTPASAAPHLVVVDIRDGFANYTHVPLALSCDQGPSTDLQQGDHYNLNLTVTEDQDFECTATWLRWFATWDAFEAKRDEGHDTIYWLVNEDGFHHSWDGSKWKLMEHWHTD